MLAGEQAGAGLFLTGSHPGAGGLAGWGPGRAPLGEAPGCRQAVASWPGPRCLGDGQFDGFPPVKSASPRCGPRWGAAAFETPVLPGQGRAGAGPVLAWEINPGFPNPACTEQFQSP